MESMQQLLHELAQLRAGQAEENIRLARIERALSGDGTEDMPGMILRLDRLEQDRKRQEFWTKTALGAAIVGIFSFIGNAAIWIAKTVK